MDKKSRILLWVFVIMLIASVGATYYRYVVQKDYLIYAHAPCEPSFDSCFYITPEDGDTVEYYKKIYRKAYSIPLCDPADASCEALTCPMGEADCSMTACSAETAEEGESCSQ